MKKIIVFLLIAINSFSVQGQTVTIVEDAKGINKTTLWMTIHNVCNFIRENGTEILEWTQKALEIRNGIIINWEMAQEIWEILNDLGEMSLTLIQQINAYEDERFTQEQRIAFIIVVIELVGERDAYIEIFRSIISLDGGIVMDDRGRILALRNTYKELIGLRKKFRSLTRQISRILLKRNSSRRQKLQIKNLLRYAGDAVYVLD